jgi:hypothetical protein
LGDIIVIIIIIIISSSSSDYEPISSRLGTTS